MVEPGARKGLHRFRSKLQTKIIAWTFIPTAIILFVVASTEFFAYQQVWEEVTFGRDEELTRLSASEISSSFEEYVDRLNALARLPGVHQGAPQQQRAELFGFKNQLVLFDGGVYLLNNLGIVVASQPERPELIGLDWSDRPFFRSMVRNQAVVFTDLLPIGPESEDVIAIATPILGVNDAFKGVAVGMFRLDAVSGSPFFGTIIKLRIGQNGNAFLVDGNGLVIYASDTALIGSPFSEHPASESILPGQVGVARSHTAETGDVVIAYAPVPRTPWTLVIEQDWNEVVRSSQGYQQFLLLLLFLGVVIPTTVVIIGVRRITGPVDDFKAAAQRIASGDFTHPISVNTKDELEELAHHFNQMAAQLKESYETLELRVDQRTQELKALNSIAAVVSRSLNLDQILPDALSKTIEVLGMDAGAVFRLDPETQTLTLAAHQGISPDLVAIAEKMTIETSIIDQVVQTRRMATRLVSDYPPSPVREVLEKDGWKTVVSIPLLAQEKALGAMNIVSRAIVQPSPEDFAVPAAIGQQIGVAMDNARLYNQTVEYAREMEIAHQEAEAARVAAEAANNAKSDFLANVSHELRTPLVSIFGFARIVEKRLQERVFPLVPAEDERVQRVISQIEEDLGIILNEGQRLMTLINNLLDLEKIEAGKMEWQSLPVAIDEVVRQAARSTLALFEEKALSLVVDLPAGLPEVNGDPDRLLQVVINLLSNAVKFTSQGTVTIRARLTKDEVVIDVTDQGIGISPQDQARLFEKFRQVGDTLTEKPKGTGLGLAISKEIIEHHGGRMWMVSEPGKGSTFSFSLPVNSQVTDHREGQDGTQHPDLLFVGGTKDGERFSEENPDR